MSDSNDNTGFDMMNQIAKLFGGQPDANSGTCAHCGQPLPTKKAPPSPEGNTIGARIGYPGADKIASK